MSRRAIVCLRGARENTRGQRTRAQECFHTHGNAGMSDDAFQFLINLVCYEADTDVCLYPPFWRNTKKMPFFIRYFDKRRLSVIETLRFLLLFHH